MKTGRARIGAITRLGRVSLVCALALGSSAALAGCSSEPAATADEDVGSLGVHLDVAPGVTLNSVDYTITGNGFTKSGTIDVSDAPTSAERSAASPLATATPSR